MKCKCSAFVVLNQLLDEIDMTKQQDFSPLIRKPLADQASLHADNFDVPGDQTQVRTFRFTVAHYVLVVLTLCALVFIAFMKVSCNRSSAK